MYDLLREMNLTGYLIGGTIRDLILDRPIKDIDLAVSINPEYFLKNLSQKIKGYTICLDRENLVFRFIAGNRISFDLSPIRGNDILEDLSKRDFTINAMAIRLEDLFGRTASPLIHDPFKGARDMDQKLIRAVSEKIFLDDPLRILRAFRLAGQLHYQIEIRTGALIRRDRELLERTATERIREELFLLLSLEEGTSQGEQLYHYGLLPILFLRRLPEKLCPEITEHAWSLGLRNLAALEEILADLAHSDSHSLRNLDALLSHISGHQATYKPLLKLAVLLAGFFEPEREKEMAGAVPPSQETEKGNLTPVDFLLRALCLTTPQRKFILTCLRGSREMLYLFRMKYKSAKYFYRFFRDHGEAGLGAAIIGLARKKAVGAPPEIMAGLEDLFLAMICFYFAWEPKKREPILKGDFLMEHFHLSPGPEIGRLLDLLEEARAEGLVKQRDEAIRLAEELLKRNDIPHDGLPPKK
ncbi:MAG: hypothetical protein ACMUIA_06865 [bacterium]